MGCGCKKVVTKKVTVVSVQKQAITKRIMCDLPKSKIVDLNLLSKISDILSDKTKK